MRPDAESASGEIQRVKADLKDLSEKYPGAFPSGITIADDNGKYHMARALYVAKDGEEHVLFRPDGRFLRYTISTGNIPIQWDHYNPLPIDQIERDTDYEKYGGRTIAIFKARINLPS